MGDKGYVISYFVEPAKFCYYLPTISLSNKHFIKQNQNSYTQGSNVTSKAVAHSSTQGTAVRDSAVILLEGKTLTANDFMHLYDTTPYMIIKNLACCS